MHSLVGDRRATVIASLAALPLVLMTSASIAGGSIAPVGFLLAGCVLLFVLVRVIAVPADVGWLTAVVIGAFLLRCGAGAALYWYSLTTGNGGFLTGDDQMYASAAWHLVRYLRGDPEMPFVPPDWGGEYYLHATYVYVETAIFSVFGRHVLTMIVVNAACAAVAILLVADIARRLFGRRASIATACVLSAYPSLVLWAGLNLRDTMVVTFIALAIWAVHRYPGRRAAAWIVTAFLGAWAQDGLRRYVLLELAVVIPAAIAVAPAAMSLARRSAATAGAVTLSAALLLYTGAIGMITVVPTEMLASLENIRNTMTVGRLAFSATPPPSIATASPTPIPTAAPTAARSPAPRTPTRVPARTATSAPRPTATAAGAPRPTATAAGAPRPTATAAVVSAPTAAPGIIDTIVGAVGSFFNPVPSAPPPAADEGGDASAVPPSEGDSDEGAAGDPDDSEQATPVASLAPIAPSVAPLGALAVVDAEKLVVTNTLAHLPRGVAYSLFAPFPWEIRSWVDLVLALEALLWYLVLAAAATTIVKQRRRWRSFVPEVLLVGANVVVFALTEGNSGTLLRHRAMIIPFVVLLASPGLLGIARNVLARIASRRVAHL